MSWTRKTEGVPVHTISGEYALPSGTLIRAKKKVLHKCQLPKPPGLFFGRNRLDLYEDDSFICIKCQAEWEWNITWADYD